MQREQKILVTFLWGLAVLAMLSVVGMGLWANRQPDEPRDAFADATLPQLFDAPSFELTDQNGKTVSMQSLRGSVWISMVFFSQCPGVCPMMMSRLTAVEKTMPKADVKVVAFSLDPEHDTPEALKDYAERFQANQSRWHLLTGPKDRMYEIASKFKLAAEPATDKKPIIHTQKVLLIDKAGHVRGIYDTNDDDSMKKLAADATTLASEKTTS